MARKETERDAVVDTIDEEIEFAGVDEFGQAPPKKAKHFWPSVKRMIGLLAPEKVKFSLVVVLVVASALAAFVAAVVSHTSWDPSAKNIIFAVIGVVWLVVGLSVLRVTRTPALSSV